MSWIALSFFWWGGALWTGASLVAIAPRRGMAACATLAVAGAALMIGLGVTAVWHDWLKGDFLLFYTTGLFAAAPLLAGGVIARRRMIAWGITADGVEGLHAACDEVCNSRRRRAAGGARSGRFRLGAAPLGRRGRYGARVRRSFPELLAKAGDDRLFANVSRSSIC